MKLAIKTAPEKLPVEVETAIEFAKIDDDKVEIIELFIGSATELVEAYIGRALINRTYTLSLNDWPEVPNGSEWWDGVRDGPISSLVASAAVELPKPPTVSISEVRVFDADNQSSIVDTASYQLELDTMGAKLHPVGTWPIPGRDIDGIQIDYVAGYGADPAAVNPAIRTAILHSFVELYEKRGGDGVVPAIAKPLLNSWRVLRL